jgi:hypothetical protein
LSTLAVVPTVVVAVCAGRPDPANSKQDRRAEYFKGTVEVVNWKR